MIHGIWLLTALAVPPAAPTFQELMDPALYPRPMHGMRVEGATLAEGRLRVVTTGAVIELDSAAGEVRFAQRIGHPRPVAVLRFGRPVSGLKLVQQTDGLVLASAAEPSFSVRINGDSLFMLHVHEPLEVAVERRIVPAWQDSYGAHHLLVDEWGGFGLYCSQKDLPDGYDPDQERIATYRLPADQVLWVAVCPPKPYDWERSLRDRVVWHWSNQTGYPSDADLLAWQPYGNTVLLQSEVMLWKDWNLAFEPRLGPDEFAHVRATLHAQGQRFIVYTSPYYFLKGTPNESKAMNSFAQYDQTGWPPGWPTGENMGLFMAAITRVMHESKPDGLYFDGQYTENPAALYALARGTRELLGEDGILEWHSTGALGPGQCYLPQADAYVDFVLRGEGQGGIYSDQDYLRYFVSGYNVHNSIGVLCLNGPPGMQPDLARNTLRANARIHFLAGWLGDERSLAAYNADYAAKLTPAMREEVDREVDRRQAEVAAKAAARTAELAALASPPKWGEPAVKLDFATLPAAEQVVSPANPAPFRVADGALQVTGHAHTYAYLQIPLKLSAGGLVIKLRGGTDGGMSWGPAVALCWPDGTLLRLGLRSDGKLQSDCLGNQALFSTQDPTQWIWLRARWLSRVGVIERSPDGEQWEVVSRFEHRGKFAGETAALLVGKVPYSGQPMDYSEPGEVGRCEFAQVEVYAR
ncbi:MAG: hypothetical protein HYU66_12545 [Armatimonadetes bacterium]|nr:hypothetical protein [Armatimonadota bacterium]